MEVVFLRAFIQDFKGIQDVAVRRKVERTVHQLQSVRSLRELKHVKKLEGHSNAYRIRLGDYRIGFFLANGTVELARIANRRDIYRGFP